MYRRIGDLAASGATIAYETGTLLTNETQDVVSNMKLQLDSAQGANAIAETQAKNDIIMYQRNAQYQAAVTNALSAITADIAHNNKYHDDQKTLHDQAIDQAKESFNETKVNRIYSTVLK